MKLPDHRSLPIVMAWVKVKIANLLDTTDPDVAAVLKPFLRRERIHWRAIQDRREAVSQAIGRALSEICFTGLIAHAQVLPGTRNIVIFRQKVGPEDRLESPELKTVY